MDQIYLLHYNIKDNLYVTAMCGHCIIAVAAMKYEKMSVLFELLW